MKALTNAIALVFLLQAFLGAFLAYGQVGPDVDGDGIPNELELNGYFYDSSTGLKSCDPVLDDPCFLTDYQQWSTDGDPFSDFDEISGANMPVTAPYDHPYVAAQHIIAVEMVRYSVTPRATITDAKGGSFSTAYENSTTSTYEENVSVTATAAVGPGGLAGYSASGTVTESIAQTSSTTRTTEVDWNTATTVDLNEAADLSLAIFVRNAGSAQARDVRLFFNLKIGAEVVASIRTPIVTGLLDAGQQFPSAGQGPWIIENSEDANGITRPITLTMDQLKAIESGAPLTLTVTEVLAEILRWNPEGGGSWSCSADISCDWASYESRIRASTVNLTLHIGDERRQFRVFGGKNYSNPADEDLVLKLRDVLNLVVDVNGPNDAATIEGRPYPSDWYAMTSSDELIATWEAAGSPNNLLGLTMSPGVDLRLSSPGADPNPIIDLATYSPDLRRIYVSARAGGGFPIREVTAHVTVEGEDRIVPLAPGVGGFYTNESLFASPAAGGGEVTVINARGDMSTRGLQLPVSQSASCDDIEAAYALVSDGEYLLFEDRDLAKPALAYCRFFLNTPPETYYWIDRTPDWAQEADIRLGGVAFVGEQTAFAVGGVDNRPVVLRTQDGGATWDSVAVRQIGTQPFLQSVDFKPDAGVGIAVGFDYDNVSKGYAMYRSINGGATWVGRGNFDVLSAFPSFEEIRFAGGSTWFVGGGARFMRTTDDGLSWEDVESDLFPVDPNVGDIEFKNDQEGLIIAGRSQQINAIFSTNDGGDTWEIQREFDSEFWLNKLVYIGDETWIGGQGGTNPYRTNIYRSDDDGATWTPVADLASMGAGQLIDLEFTTPLRGFVLDRKFNEIDQTYAGKIWQTDDGGETWTAESLMTGGEPFELRMYDANRGIVVGNEGVLITTSGGGSPIIIVGIDEDHNYTGLPDRAEIVLDQNYPNPFSTRTTFVFALETSGRVNFSIYDLLGREVATLIADEWRASGTHRVSFEAGQLSAGLYFYRLDAESDSITRRMLIIH